MEMYKGPVWRICMWILGLKGLIARENNGTERGTPSLALGMYVNFTKVYF